MSSDHIDDEDIQGLMAGMRDVADYQRGKREGFITHVPRAVNVEAIRAARQLSQQGFASTYGFSVSALRDWEQGRRKPERAARILLAMIDRAPETVESVMRGI
jgi:putative transcriptional regulator